MATRFRPSLVIRGLFSSLGVLFLPLGIWFIRDPKHRYLTESIVLLGVGLLGIYYGFRRDTKLMEALEALDDSV